MPRRISSADAACRDPARSRAVNVEATAASLSDWAAEHDRRLIYTSTDLVFDGQRSWYREDDPAHPILVYGRTKLAAERFVLAGPRGTGRPAEPALRPIALRRGPGSSIAPWLTPASGQPAGLLQRRVSHAARLRHRGQPPRSTDRSETRGTIHLGGPERLSRFELMSRAAAALDIDPVLVLPNRRADVAMPEPRPADVSLDSTRLHQAFDELACLASKMPSLSYVEH